MPAKYQKEPKNAVHEGMKLTSLIAREQKVRAAYLMKEAAKIRQYEEEHPEPPVPKTTATIVSREFDYMPPNDGDINPYNIEEGYFYPGQFNTRK